MNMMTITIIIVTATIIAIVTIMVIIVTHSFLNYLSFILVSSILLSYSKPEGGARDEWISVYNAYEPNSHNNMIEWRWQCLLVMTKDQLCNKRNSSCDFRENSWLLTSDKNLQYSQKQNCAEPDRSLGERQIIDSYGSNWVEQRREGAAGGRHRMMTIFLRNHKLWPHSSAGFTTCFWDITHSSVLLHHYWLASKSTIFMIIHQERAEQPTWAALRQHHCISVQLWNFSFVVLLTVQKWGGLQKNGAKEDLKRVREPEI